jgi:hypothetical protein
MNLVHLSNANHLTPVKVTERNYWKSTSDFQRHVQPRRFVRVGRFNVVIGHNDLAISVGHESDGIAELTQCRGMHDTRQFILEAVSTAIGQFPGNYLEAALLLEITAERRAWARGEK